ncbi:MAG: glycosyltransferase [Cyanobacteriota bacterium]|nr:glycosyltransferase [Cyanobacteriota bacterium]
MEREVCDREKIAIFFAARNGGAQRAMVNLANGLTRLGQTVEIVMPEAKGPHLCELLPEIQIFDLATRNPEKVVSRLVRYLREHLPSRMLAAQQQTNIAAVIACRLAEISLHLVINQQNHLSILAKSDRRISVRVLPYLARLFYPRADGIVAASQGVAEDLIKTIRIPSDKISTIYNPVVSDRLLDFAKNLSNPTAIISPTKPIILGAGRLTKQKDFVALIRAFAKVRTQLNSHLIVIGEGENRFQLEQLVRTLNLTKDVSLPGYVDNPYRYMAQASLFVLSSAWEGFGNVLVEAMAVGTPVVSTDCPSGPSEILEGGKYGKLVPVGDESRLAEAMVETLKHPPDAKLLKARALDFSILPIAQQFLNLFESFDNSASDP